MTTVRWADVLESLCDMVLQNCTARGRLGSPAPGVHRIYDGSLSAHEGAIYVLRALGLIDESDCLRLDKLNGGDFNLPHMDAVLSEMVQG